MNVELKYKLPITNKEEWENMDIDKSFDAYSRFMFIEFFQTSGIRMHYYNREIMTYEGIVINWSGEKVNYLDFDYIKRH